MNSTHEHIQDLLYRMPVLQYVQLERWMYLAYGIHSSAARDAVLSEARVGKLILSENGYVTTKRYLPLIQVWDKDPVLNDSSLFRLKTLEPLRIFLDQIDCFWVVINSLPSSLDFTASPKPFQLQYASSGENCLVQIARIHREDSVTAELMLKALPYPSQEWQQHLTRIAVLDEGMNPSTVPHLGFIAVVKVNNKDRQGFTLLQERIGSAVWIPQDSLNT